MKRFGPVMRPGTEGTPNQALQQTAAAILVLRDITAHSAAAAAELMRSAAEGYQKGDADVGEESSGQTRPREGHAEVRQEHHRQGVQGIHGRGASRDEGARPRAEGGRGPRP